LERLVALDAYGVNPGDLAWTRFEQLGELTVFDHSAGEELVSRAREATALLVDMLPLGANELSQLPNLRYVGLFATGHDHIDIETAARLGIAVTNVPEYSTPSVAQMTFALLLDVTNRIRGYAAYVANGLWAEGREFRYLESPLIELSGKTIGILGFGTIGAAVARIAAALGMRILAWSRTSKTTPGVDVEWTELSEVFRQADVVSLHLPLTDRTAGIVNRDTIGLMKRSSIIVNTARGGLIVDQDLADALSVGRVAAAALDVVGQAEPPRRDNPLFRAPNCLITPHVAWATREARERCLREAACNLELFLKGKRRNRVV
jgi:glycerate dehydrogenase